MPQSLCFNDFTFSPVTRDNQPWFKSLSLPAPWAISGKIFLVSSTERMPTNLLLT